MQEQKPIPIWLRPVWRGRHWVARAGAWWRSSLSRWFIAPLLVVILLAVVLRAVFSFTFIEACLTKSHIDFLRTSGSGIEKTIATHILDLGTDATFAARLESVVAVTMGADPELAATQVGDMARLHGIPVVLLTDGFGQPIRSFTDRVGLAMPPGWNTPFGAEATLQQAIQRELIAFPAEAGVAYGLISRSDNSLLYVIAPVSYGGQVLGMLILATPVRWVLEDATNSLTMALVLHDAAGSPIFSTLPGLAVAAPDLPALSSADGHVTGKSPPVFEAWLFSEQYRYVVLPIQVRETGLGYISVWQPVAPIMRAVRRWQLAMSGLIALGLLVTLGIGLLLLRRVTLPVRAMVRAAEAMAGGDLTQTVSEISVGELSLLARAFNRLAGQVQGQTTALRDQVERANYLFAASAELGRTLDLDESLPTAAEAIYGLGGLAYVVILVGRGEVGPYTCQAVRGLPAEVAQRILGQTYPVPLWGVMARALVSRLPLIIDDVVAQQRPREGEFDWAVGGSMAIFPVAGVDGPLALILVGAEQAGRFGADELGDMVFALARIASHSVLNAQLYLEATRSQEQLVTLQMISRIVATTTEVETLLAVVVREAAAMVGDSDAWLLYQCDDEANETGRVYGQQGVAPLHAWGHIHQEAAAWVMRAAQPIFYHPEQPLAQSPVWVHSGPAMCVPLEIGDATIGALVIVSRKRERTFYEDEMIVARTLANSAAGALYTARLAQQLRCA